MAIASSGHKINLSRRELVVGLAGLSIAPSIVTAADARTYFADGIASGDITQNSAIIWARSNKSAKMLVDWSSTPTLRDSQRVVGPIVTKKLAIQVR